MANKRTANAKPDYDAIRKKMVYVFTIMGIPAQDVEDLVQEVCEKVIECWDPEKEKHWDKPGEALAYIISYKVAARYFERIRRMPPTPLANIDESELAKSKIEPNPQDEAVLEDELRSG
jgi:DNA-directed RNA polymerase specialized sigma24 family protein